MSRGIGALQRRLLAALDDYPKGATALELTLATQPEGLGEFQRPGDPVCWNGNTLSAVRRALHGLDKRDLVRLGHDGRCAFESKAAGVNVILHGCELLIAWLPKYPGPSIFPGRRQITLNPKRCVPAKRVVDTTLSQGAP